jgi:hypothetical protein
LDAIHHGGGAATSAGRALLRGVTALKRRQPVRGAVDDGWRSHSRRYSGSPKQ